MDSRSYNFSTARKRSTLLETTTIYFPKEGDTAPRNVILSRECAEPLGVFNECLKERKEEAKCLDEKQVLNECAAPAFRMVNTTPEYKYD